MTERVVILDPAKPLQFLDEACSALADAVSDTSDTDAAHDELSVVTQR